MLRLLSLTRWTLREPTHWRLSLLVFLVLVFSMTSEVALPGGNTPEMVVENTLRYTLQYVVPTAYPLLFSLIAILATVMIVLQRDSGGLATLQALGFRRWEIFAASTLAVLLLNWIPALAAVLVLPPIVEPALFGQGNLAALYPTGYWTSVPRLLLVILFLTLFAAAFSMVIRRPAIAFGAMIAFFFVGWSLASSLGPYFLLAPQYAFLAAYSLFDPLPGIPLDPNYAFLIYLGVGALAFLAALVYAERRGEVA